MYAQNTKISNKKEKILMMQTMKRGLALLIVLVMCVALVPALNLNVNAATVDYVYSGSYIYN
jgi:hypothetical protein